MLEVVYRAWTRCQWYTKQRWLDAKDEQLGLPIAKCAVAGVMNYKAGISQPLQKHTDHMDTKHLRAMCTMSRLLHYCYSQKEHFTSKAPGFVSSNSGEIHDVPALEKKWISDYST